MAAGEADTPNSKQGTPPTKLERGTTGKARSQKPSPVLCDQLHFGGKQPGEIIHDKENAAMILRCAAHVVQNAIELF